MTWRLTRLRAWDLWSDGNRILTTGFNDLLDRARREKPEAIAAITKRFDKESDALYSLIFDTWYDKKNYTYTAEEQFRNQVEYTANQAVAKAVADYESGNLEGGEWTPNDWLIENMVSARKRQLIALAATRFGPTLAKAIIDPAIRRYADAMHATIGRTYPNYQAWQSDEASAFKDARDYVTSVELQDKPHLDPEYIKLADRVHRAPRVYGEGINYYRLDMSKDEVEEALQVLAKQAMHLPVQQINDFNAVYDAYHTYYDLLYSNPPRPAHDYPYTREVKFTKPRVQYLKDYAKEKFDEKNWYSIERNAAGKDVDVGRMKQDALQAIYDEIDKIADDPWSGPLTRDANGRVVPYAALPVGEALYKSWIYGLISMHYNAIRDAVESASRDALAEFTVSQSYVDSLIAAYKNVWENDYAHGVALLSDARYRYSIKDPYFAVFKNWLNAQVGSTWPSVEAFERAVADEFQTQRDAAITKAQTMSSSTAKSLPKRYLEIKSAVDNHLDTLSIDELGNYYYELQLLAPQIPGDYASLHDYDSTIGKIQGRLQELQAEPMFIPHRADTNSFLAAAMQRFDDKTQYDKEVADFLVWDFSSHHAAYKDGLDQKLVALEGKPITPTAYAKAQAQAETEAYSDSGYNAWRANLLSTARQRLQALIDQLKAGNKSNLGIAQSATKLQHPNLHDLVQQLDLLVKQSVAGAVLPAALKPFARFTPLKSVSGFDAEEFSFNHMQKFIDNWLKPRLAKGETVYVNPKINGYRLIMEVKDHKVRIYMEEDTRDFSNIYKHLADELKSLEDVILDGEMVEAINGKITPRAELAKFRRADVDDTHILVCVFDILYWKGEDLHDLPYEERLKKLDEFFNGRKFDHLKKLPYWPATSVDEVIKLAKKANDYPASEGAMFKTAQSKYIIGRRTHEWSKIKAYSDLHVKVLGKTRTKGNDWVYRCGVLYQGEPDVADSEIEEFGGRKYVILGNTFRTDLDAKPGDKLEVAVSEVVEANTPQGKKYNWMLPKVKDFSYRDKVDTLAYAKQVGQLLQAGMVKASIDQPFKVLTEIKDNVLTTTSTDALYNYKAQLWDILGDFNYDRLRDYAYAIINLIRSRLGQVTDPNLGDIASATKLYEVGVHPRVTPLMLDDIESEVRGIEEDIEMDRDARLSKARHELRILQVNREFASDDIRPRVDGLIERVKSLIDKLQASGTGSLLDYDRRLTELRSRVDDLVRNPPADAEAQAHEILVEINSLGMEMGASKDYFQDRIDALGKDLEPFLHPRISGAEIERTINELRDRLSMGTISSWTRDLIRTRLTLLESSLEDWQKPIYQGRLDALRELLENVTVSGGIARKVDIGCGDAKPRGYIGVDIKPYPGVDKLWDLEKGMPFADNSVDEVRAYHVLEHLSDPIKTMTEIWRVLKPGGILRFEFPSAKGEGAFADPTHKSYWTKLSLAFYTDDELRKSHDIPCKYKLLTVEEEKDPKTGAVYVRGLMRAIKPDKLQAAKLTREGEESGANRLDWMATEPVEIPVKGTLWTHIKGIDPDHKDLSYDELMRLPLKDDTLNLHHDVRFRWGKNFLEGMTLFLGNQQDRDKLLKYRGGKLGATIKEKQPPIWSDPKELDGRLFPPHDVGNVSGTDTWGKMFFIDDVELLPSRMRPKPKGKRYWEFYLKFKKHPELNGLWCITEEAGKGYQIPFFFFRLKTLEPFWLRGRKDHEKEIESMPDWQKPTEDEVKKFLGE